VCVLNVDPARVGATRRELYAAGICADFREPGAARDAAVRADTEMDRKPVFGGSVLHHRPDIAGRRGAANYVQLWTQQ
jgi:hypothetical protein